MGGSERGSEFEKGEREQRKEGRGAQLAPVSVFFIPLDRVLLSLNSEPAMNKVYSDKLYSQTLGFHVMSGNPFIGRTIPIAKRISVVRTCSILFPVLLPSYLAPLAVHRVSAFWELLLWSL